MTEQIELQFPSSAVDAETAAICDLVHGDPLHERDRAAVVAAIMSVAKSNNGVVDVNKVRKAVPPWVFPRIFGPVYRALVIQGVLTQIGWTINDDKAGNNTGKPSRVYRLDRALAGAA